MKIKRIILTVAALLAIVLTTVAAVGYPMTDNYKYWSALTDADAIDRLYAIRVFSSSSYKAENDADTIRDFSEMFRMNYPCHTMREVEPKEASNIDIEFLSEDSYVMLASDLDCQLVLRCTGDKVYLSVNTAGTFYGHPLLSSSIPVTEKAYVFSGRSAEPMKAWIAAHSK